MKMKLLITGFLVAVLSCALFLWDQIHTNPEVFDGEKAYQAVKTQMEFGPRIPGSEAHEKTIAWSIQQFQANGWLASEVWDYQSGHQVRNILAKKGKGEKLILLGAHYDSRMVADKEPIATTNPVPGANDGASGVAVLVELSRTLQIPAGVEVWLVLFDAEDQGDLYGWDWIIGSTAFAESMEVNPDAVIVVDMVGDVDLQLPKERTSDQELIDQIWGAAAKLGYQDTFLDEPGYGILDDHTPFLQRGFRAVDIIDFDYPYWHTLEDTEANVSAESLEKVGRTLEKWIEANPSVE